MLSKRSTNVEPSITMHITNLANEMKKAGEPVIGFGAGEPDFDTPEHIKQAGIRAIQEGKNKYTAASGIIELKQAILQKIQSDQGLSYETSSVVVSCGAKHSCYNVMAALLDPGDEVIIPAPYWVSYPQQVRLADGVPVVIETTVEAKFKITPDQLDAVITDKTKLLILNSPSNPTGMIYSKAELEALAEIVVKHNIYVMSDEIYEKLIYDNLTHTSIASLSDEVRDLTIIVNGVSKAYAMTGWRIGYTVSLPEIASAMSKMQSHITSNPTTAAQWAAVEALTGPQDAVGEMLSKFDERRRLMVDTLSQIDGISCLLPEGAFYAFPVISGCFGKKSASGVINNSLDFCEYLLKETQVACVPGAGFGADECLRLSYATSPDNISEGLSRLATWVNGLS